ncbi:MAG: hypothetical protein ACI9DK_002183 [Vicingaceae bacterium]|jgi:hypothetical protein
MGPQKNDLKTAYKTWRDRYDEINTVCLREFEI